jgi:hypothetical protein
MKYTVIRSHPVTGVVTVLREGEPVPEWAADLVHEDDLVEVEAPTASAPSGTDDERVREAEEVARAATEALSTAEERISELEDELASAIAEKVAARGYPDGDPVEDWKGDELDAYAAAKNVDISSAKNKAEKAAALLAARN